MTPQGIVAVCRFLDVPLGRRCSRARHRLVAVCADVRDPGNAGTVIRCADASGAGGVVLTGNSVDPYNDKTVRATVGSLFHVPVALRADAARDGPPGAGRRAHRARRGRRGETDLDRGRDSGLLRRPVAWLFGNEAWGLPEELAALADHRVSIPILGRAESLNLVDRRGGLPLRQRAAAPGLVEELRGQCSLRLGFRWPCWDW